MIDLRLPAVRDAAWWKSVAGWAQALRPYRRVALVEPKPGVFAAALLGAWAAGVEVVLPPDSTSATASLLATEVDGFVGEWARAPHPVVADAVPQTAVAWQAPADERRVLTVFTSGSSGQPLAVPKRFGQLAAEVQALEQVFGTVAGDVSTVSTVSHQHLYGLLFTVLWPLAAGRPLPQLRYDMVEPLQHALASPCIVVSSPALLRRLPPGVSWATQVRAVFSSGAPLPPEASEATQSLMGQWPIEVFGSSETGGIASRQAASSWVPLPGVQVRLAEEQLEVQSPFVDGEWYRTNDAARLTEGGFELLGRIDRIVKLEDKRVSLNAVEAALRSCSLFVEVTVVVLEGVKQALGVVAVPSTWRPKREIVKAMQASLAGQFERSVIPRRLRLVESLPVNAQGKVRLEQLRQLFAPEIPPHVWRAVSAASAEVEIEVLAELRCLDGHFPEAPVVPGMAIVTWAAHFAREAFRLEHPLVQVEALKFKSVMRPGDRPVITLHWVAATQRLTFSFRGPHGVYASGRLVPPVAT